MNMENEKLLSQAESYIVSKRKEYERDLANLIAVESVGTDPCGEYVFGKGSAEAIDKMIEIGRGHGFKTENHDYYCTSVLYGDGDEELGIVAHLDVVPAGDGWSYPPYSLTVENGLLIGRGTEDDKGPAVAALYAMRFFKDNGIKLPFSIRLLLGGDEERGMGDLPHFLESHKPPFFSFTPDSEFPVCCGEKGIGTVDVEFGEKLKRLESICGGTVSNAVAGKAVAVVKDVATGSLAERDGISVSYADGKATVTATGKTAHAAMPYDGVNAISVLAAYLLDSLSFDGSEELMLKFLRDICGEYLGNGLGIAASDPLMNELTCVGGLLKTVDGKALQNFNIRFPIPGTWKKIVESINATAEQYGAAIVNESHTEGYMFSPEKPEIAALTAACEAITGEESAPYTMGGGTYARSFPNTVAFGCTQEKYRGLLGEGRGQAHDRDEYLSVAEFEDAVKIFVLSIANIAKLKENE